jgi:hypothetical protein
VRELATLEVDVHAVLLAAESAVTTELPIPPAGVGLIAFGALVALLAVAYAFRNVGNRN